MHSALSGLSGDSSASVDGVGRVLDEVETRVAQVRLASDEMTWCGGTFSCTPLINKWQS